MYRVVAFLIWKQNTYLIVILKLNGFFYSDINGVCLNMPQILSDKNKRFPLFNSEIGTIQMIVSNDWFQINGNPKTKIFILIHF